MVQYYRLLNPLIERRGRDTYGCPGFLIYQPLDSHLYGGGQWLPSTKWTNAKPAFKQLSDFTEWHYATKPDHDRTPNHVHRQLVQVKFGTKLSIHLAQFNAAIDQVWEFTDETLRNGSGLDNPTPGTTQPLLSVGLIDASQDRGKSGTLVLASVAGKGGQILRLNTLSNVQKVWDEFDSVTLKTHDGVSDELLWRGDGFCFTRLEFWSGMVGTSRLRLLLAQQLHGTTIFKPEMHRVPVESKGVVPGQRPSYIEVNPMITLKVSQTGGAAHVDVAFNPGDLTSRSQVAVIDELGYWSVWDLVALRGQRKLVLYTVGHVKKGFLSEPSGEKVPDSDFLYRIKWVSPPNSINTPEGEAELRAEYLALCDEANVQVLHLPSRTASKKLVLSPQERPDRICDMKKAPVGSSYVLLLTNTHFRLVDVLPGTSEGDLSKSRPIVVLSWPHGRPNEELKIGIVADHNSMQSNGFFMTYLYSTKNSRVDIFWIRVPVTDLDYFKSYRVVYELSDPHLFRGSAHGGFHTLVFNPLAYKVRHGTYPGGSGNAHYEDGVQFYDVISQDQGLAVRHSIAAVFPAKRVSPVAAPSIVDTYQRIRSHGDLRYIAQSFVTPDSFALFDKPGLSPPKLLAKVTEGFDRPRYRDITRFVRKRISFILSGPHFIRKDDPRAPAGWHPTSIATTIAHSLEQRGSSPLCTLLELAWNCRMDQPIQHYARDWKALVELLQHTDAVVFAFIGGIDPGIASMKPLHKKLLKLHIAPRSSKSKDASDFAFATQAALEVVCDLFLSSATIIDRLFVPGGYDTIPQTQNATTETNGLPSPGATMSANSTSRPTSPEKPTDLSNSDNPLSRLKAFAIKTGEPTTGSKTQLLSRWKLGVEPGTGTSHWKHAAALEREAWLADVAAERAEAEARKKRRLNKFRALGILPPEGEPSSQGLFASQLPYSGMPVAASFTNSQGVVPCSSVGAPSATQPELFAPSQQMFPASQMVPNTQPLTQTWSQSLSQSTTKLGKKPGQPKKRAKGF